MVNLPFDVNTFNYMGVIAKTMYWLGYGLLCLIVMGALVAVYFYLQYNIRADVYPLCGGSREGVWSWAKRKTNRLKEVKGGNEWRPLWPLFNKLKIKPFNPENIYPGKRIIVFQYGKEWVPGEIGINKEGKDINAVIRPKPYHVQDWQSLKHREHAQEFAEHSFWEDNKYFFMVIITAGLCLVMVGLTVYFTYNYATGGLNAATGLAESLKNFNAIPVAGG